MNFSFHPEAGEEFIEAVDYYENFEPGLGLDFLLEVHATIRNAVDYPTLWPKIEDEVQGVVGSAAVAHVLRHAEPRYDGGDFAADLRAGVRDSDVKPRASLRPNIQTPISEQSPGRMTRG